MGIQDEELILRALQATGGDIQAALELIFAGGAPWDPAYSKNIFCNICEVIVVQIISKYFK